jgi:hypothetical protein
MLLRLQQTTGKRREIREIRFPSPKAVSRGHSVDESIRHHALQLFVARLAIRHELLHSESGIPVVGWLAEDLGRHRDDTCVRRGRVPERHRLADVVNHDLAGFDQRASRSALIRMTRLGSLPSPEMRPPNKLT